MIGRTLIEHLNQEPKPGCCRASLPTHLFVGTVKRETVELSDIAAVTYREHVETGAPIRLPMPPEGTVRAWMKRSAYNPRSVDVRVTDEVFSAVVEWPRDYFDLTEDDVAKAAGKVEVLSSTVTISRAIVSNRMIEGAPKVHRTFAMEKGKWGEEFEVYQEFDSVKDALEKFGVVKPVVESEAKEIPSCLRLNGLGGLLDTSKGTRLWGAIQEAIEKKLLIAPMKFEAYRGAVKEPLTAVEAGGLINLGVLCSKCPGMTWGEVGYEVMRGAGGRAWTRVD
jgi:hypothetical protein